MRNKGKCHNAHVNPGRRNALRPWRLHCKAIGRQQTDIYRIERETFFKTYHKITIIVDKPKRKKASKKPYATERRLDGNSAARLTALKT
jgi:hypothetical protein